MTNIELSNSEFDLFFEMLESKLIYLKKEYEKYTDEDRKEIIEKQSHEAYSLWMKLNYPAAGTPNGAISYFSENKRREIQSLTIGVLVGA